MWFRIGINLGDVIIDGERIYGDGVNLLAAGLGLPVLALGFYFWVDMHARTLSGKPPNSNAPVTASSQKAPIAVLPFKNLSGDSNCRGGRTTGGDGVDS